MKNLLTIEHLHNFLVRLQSEHAELANVIIYKADARCGKKAALARTGEQGAINTITDFMTYAELNQFMRGYMFRAEKRFHTKQTEAK